jgi:hypothetical protein
MLGPNPLDTGKHVRFGRSVQLGRASAPTMPQPVQTMCGPKLVAGAI